MGISKINNQAIEVYNSSQDTFNEVVDSRFWHEDYFHKITPDDTTQIVFDTEIDDENINDDSDFSKTVTGTITSLSPAEVNDSGATFLTDVTEGMIVVNETSFPVVTGVVTSVISDTRLILDNDLGFILSDDYLVSSYLIEGSNITLTDKIEKTSGGEGSFERLGLTTSGKVYKVTVNISSFSSTSDGDQIRVIIGDNTVLSLDETDDVIGSHVVYGYISTTDTLKMEFDNGINATVTEFSVSELFSLYYEVLDCDTDSIEYTSTDDDIQVSPTDAQIMASFDWSNIGGGYTSQGCFYIKITQLSATTVGGILSSGSNDSLNVNKLLDSTATFVTDGVEEGDFVFNTTTNEESRVASVEGEDELILDDNIFTGAADYEVRAAVTAPDNILRTDCFHLDESHQDTIKISGTNIDKAFGIDFVNVNYNPVIRVLGQLTTAKYSGERENEEDSQGVRKTLYFKKNKIKGLFIYQQPEFIHDFISNILGYDELIIDDVEYVTNEESYEPVVERISGRIPDLSNATTEVVLKEQLNVNRFC